MISARELSAEELNSESTRARFGFCGALKPIMKILSVMKTQSELCERRGFSAEHKDGSCGSTFGA